QSPKCGNGNNPLDKTAARLILETLSGRLPLEGGEAGSARPSIRAMGRGEETEPLPQPRRRSATEGGAARERTLILDIETQKSAEEVGGWQNIAAMKLALAVTYNDVSAQFKTYHEKDVDRLLLDLVMADKVVGYNIDRFDLVVLKAYTDWDLSRIRTCDMLADIYR